MENCLKALKSLHLYLNELESEEKILGEKKASCGYSLDMCVSVPVKV